MTIIPFLEQIINFHTYEHQRIIIIKNFKIHFKNLHVDTFKQRCQPTLDDVYKVKAVFIVVLDRTTQILGNLP